MSDLTILEKTRGFLEDRLRALGCAATALPSPLLGANPGSWRDVYFRLASALHGITHGRWVATPSLVVVGSARALGGERDPIR